MNKENFEVMLSEMETEVVRNNLTKRTFEVAKVGKKLYNKKQFATFCMMYGERYHASYNTIYHGWVIKELPYVEIKPKTADMVADFLAKKKATVCADSTRVTDGRTEYANNTNHVRTAIFNENNASRDVVGKYDGIMFRDVADNTHFIAKGSANGFNGGVKYHKIQYGKSTRRNTCSEEYLCRCIKHGQIVPLTSAEQARKV